MRFWILSFLFLLVVGCAIPTAAPEKNPELVVATDLLTSEDSLLLDQFARKNHVKIILKELSPDSLIRLSQEAPFETGIDVVVIHHLYDMRRILSKNMLGSIRNSILPDYSTRQKKPRFATCGVDPFVCVSKPGITINIYDDLFRYTYVNDLSRKSEAHFFSPFEERLHRVKTFERIEKLKATAVPKKRFYRDSADAILTSYSNYKGNISQDSTWMDFSQVQFPNISTSGIFCDKLTIGIIRQNSHYSMAEKFVAWILEPHINQKFTSFRGYNPAQPTVEYRCYPTPPQILMQYHTMIERMLKEMKKTANMTANSVGHGS